MLVRFIASALIGFGLIELSLSWVENTSRHTPMRFADFVLPVVLLASGIIVLIKANPLAQWISNKLDE